LTEIADRYRRLSDAFAARIAGVPTDGWGRLTPCETWTALDLVRHVVESQGLFEGLVGRDIGELPPVDADPGAAWDAARGAILVHLDDPATAEVTFDGFFGVSSFEVAVDRFLSFDLIVHGWDLARATAEDDRIDPDDVAWVVAASAGFGGAMRGPQAFGPEVEASPDADAQARMLAFLGRRS
jgi:uncharacterized protein (TIGR03086 family)